MLLSHLFSRDNLRRGGNVAQPPAQPGQPPEGGNVAQPPAQPEQPLEGGNAAQPPAQPGQPTEGNATQHEPEIFFSMATVDTS
ncbi:uncharacterized protein LOC126631110 [Malus sylvestris]|uniref:uncharacterized protein LOC126631110 n=1 Tax=Malus sylvestris TaxID=3752 RepID=UPI0021AC19CF|nr:uncharacterized protein LOC126631110 [Malus sylvestris]